MAKVKKSKGSGAIKKSYDVKSKKRKIVKEVDEDQQPVPEPEEVEDVEDDDEDLDDEEDDSDDDEETSARNRDLMDENSTELLDFDFEAFPLEEGDLEGVVNMLTQTFLRCDVKMEDLAKALIALSPFGCVIGPAEDQCDEDSENVVYGLLTGIRLPLATEPCPEYASSVGSFILSKSLKFAVKETHAQFEEALKKSVFLLVNERMLQFPTLIVPPTFKSFFDELQNFKLNKQEMVVYIMKIRVADCEASSSNDAPPKKKGKLGKAAKKRLAASKLANAEIMYDNAEDKILIDELSSGTIAYFDYAVHMDVEPGSKFHIMEKNGKTYKPFRRVVLMDKTRLFDFMRTVSQKTDV